MKRALYEQICANLTFDRESVDKCCQIFPHVNAETILAIYHRHAQNLYKVNHANVPSVEGQPDYFYCQFRLRLREIEGFRAVKGMGEEVGLPPCLMARFIIKGFLAVFPWTQIQSTGMMVNDMEAENEEIQITGTTDNSTGQPSSSKRATTDAAKVTAILKHPEMIAAFDRDLAEALQICVQIDHLTSPLVDIYRHQVGVEKEAFLHDQLRLRNILFHSEAAMRAAGYPKTPDALLAYPVALPSGAIINWIESKALFGDGPAHTSYLKDQYWPYYNRYGPGLVIYWYGFVEEVITNAISANNNSSSNGNASTGSNGESEQAILVMDRLPDELIKIDLNFTNFTTNNTWFTSE